MPDSQRTHSANVDATDLLRDLVAALQPADYERDLGGGWTVGFALAHLAFWDARHIAALEWFVRDGAFPAEDPMANAELEALVPAIHSEVISEAAVRASEQLDEAVAALSAELRDQLEQARLSYVLDRSVHRNEHIAQINAALS